LKRLFGCGSSPLINTVLQWGDGRDEVDFNRFNGLPGWLETVETVVRRRGFRLWDARVFRNPGIDSKQVPTIVCQNC
jgi:hypothetical protein